MKKSRQSIVALAALTAIGAVGPAHAESWAEHWFDNIRPEKFLTGAGEEDGLFDALSAGPVSATDPRALGGDLVNFGLERDR